MTNKALNYVLVAGATFEPPKVEFSSQEVQARIRTVNEAQEAAAARKAVDQTKLDLVVKL